MVSFLTKAARNEIEALDPGSSYAKELSKIDDVEKTIDGEIEKICNVASLAEITKAFLLVSRLKKAPVHKKEIIKNELNSIAEKLITRVETKSGPLKLPRVGLPLFSEL